MVSAALGRSRKENVDGREIDEFVELEAKKTSGLRGSQGESVSSSREWLALQSESAQDQGKWP